MRTIKYMFVWLVYVLFMLCTSFMVFLVLIGLLLSRHVDNQAEVMARVWLFCKLALAGLLGMFILGMWLDRLKKGR